MAGRKKVVQLEYNLDVDSLIKDIDKLMSDANKPELVYVNISTKQFPRRFFDLPDVVKKYIMTHPNVKVEWNNVNVFNLNRYKPGIFDVIVSLTSFPERFMNTQLIVKCLDSLISQKTKYRFHVVMSIFKDDVKMLPNNLLAYCRRNDIEILPCDEDLKGHKKYFYVMQKYYGIPMIVVDDDLVFFDNLIESLMDKHRYVDANTIWTGWCQEMNLDGNGCLMYDTSLRQNSTNETPSFRYKFGSGSGTLYPPCMIQRFQDILDLIRLGDNIYHDELVVKKISLDMGIKVGLCRNLKYKSNVGGWITHTQFIENEINPLVESKRNLHTINCSQIVVDGKKVYRGVNTEMQLMKNYVIYDNQCFQKYE